LTTGEDRTSNDEQYRRKSQRFEHFILGANLPSWQPIGHLQESRQARAVSEVSNDSSTISALSTARATPYQFPVATLKRSFRLSSRERALRGQQVSNPVE
jgi:hypothetical protein